MRGFAVLGLALLCFFAAVAKGSAEDVVIEHLGLEVTGNLELAKGKSLKSEGIVLLVHDTQGHGRMEIMASLQDGLRDLGLNSLAITLGMGLDKRHSMFDCTMEQDHRHEDAIEEIATWVQWLKEKGAPSITIAGHGRGANQAALYAINKLDKTVKRVVLISPLMQTEAKAEADYRARFGKPLRPELAKAEELVAREQGNQLLEVPGFLNCPNSQVTAGAFANYYSANEKFKTTNLLQSLTIPVLLAVGEADPNLTEIQAAEPDFAQSKTITTVVIPGADQDFRDGADDLAKKIRDFIAHRLQG